MQSAKWAVTKPTKKSTNQLRHLPTKIQIIISRQASRVQNETPVFHKQAVTMAISNTKSSILIALGAIALAATGGGGCALQALTLVKWWIPATVALVVTMMLWPLGNRLWARAIDRAWSAIVHTAVTGVVVWTVILGINMLGKDTANARQKEVTVTRVLRYKRHRTRRSGRRVIRSNEVYYEYRAEVEFAEEKLKKELYINSKQAHTMKKGEKVDVEVSNGLLGWPVFSYKIRTPKLKRGRSAGGRQ